MNTNQTGDGTYSMEYSAYVKFQENFSSGQYGTQRYGQAFCDHFKLYKMSDKKLVDHLYQLDGAPARLAIQQAFVFN